MTSMLVKAIVSAAAVALLVGTLPAGAAQKYKRKHPARAAAVATNTKYRGTDLFPAGPLFAAGVYLGDDPDPNIRFQIWRDLSGRLGGEE